MSSTYDLVRHVGKHLRGENQKGTKTREQFCSSEKSLCTYVVLIPNTSDGYAVAWSSSWMCGSTSGSSSGSSESSEDFSRSGDETRTNHTKGTLLCPRKPPSQQRFLLIEVSDFAKRNPDYLIPQRDIFGVFELIRISSGKNRSNRAINASGVTAGPLGSFSYSMALETGRSLHHFWELLS